MLKAGKIIEAIAKNIILIFWGGIVLYLTLLSLFGTCGKGQRNFALVGEEERYGSYVFYLPDKPLFLICIVLVFVIVLYMARQIFKKKIIDFSNKSIFIAIMLTVLGTVEVITIFSTKILPASDPLKLQKIAEQMLQGNFQAFEKGEYMYRYPFQSGYLLLFYYVIRCFGDNSYLVMQLINVAADIIICYSTYKITGLIWENPSIEILVAEIIFLPLRLNVIYIYGNMLGYSAAILGVYLELKYFKEKKSIYGLLSAVSITMGIIWKSNALIFLCGMILFALYQLICTGERARGVLFIGITICIYLLGNRMVSYKMETLTGESLSKGMPKTAWVVMGLEDSENSPGFYNGTSVELYEENDCDYVKTNGAAVEIIKEYMKGFINDWESGLDFFGRKIASQWNEPTYQVLVKKEPSIESGKWFYMLTHGKGSYIFMDIFNVFQTWVYFGCCLYILLRWKECTIEELFLPVMIIGGFIFQLFWEGKSQYIMIYFFLMIPYAACGYYLTTRWLEKVCTALIGRKISRKKLIIIGSTVAIIVIICFAFKNRIVESKVYQYTIGVQDSQDVIAAYEEKRSITMEGKQQ